MPGETLKLGGAQTLELHRAGADTLALTSSWEPSMTPPRMHWHPRQHERFEILAGALTVEVGGDEPRVLIEGDVLDVPPRTAHRMWNTGPDPASATWTVTPAMRTEEMFRYIDHGLGGIRSIAMLIRFRNEFRLGAPRGRRTRSRRTPKCCASHDTERIQREVSR